MTTFLWLAASAGALSLLTPCVFPMVPVTVGYFANNAQLTGRSALRTALVFSAGIVATFSALGLALAVFIGASGMNQVASNPWVNLVTAVLFTIFALNLLGVFRIGLPWRVVDRIDGSARNATGFGGALLMGVTFSVTSFTCTAPFIGTLLVLASAGEWQRPIIGMLTYSVVFASPFFVLSLAPQLASRISWDQRWTGSLKAALAAVELAAAGKFVSNAMLVLGWNVLTRERLLIVWALIGIAFAFHFTRLAVARPDRARAAETWPAFIGTARPVTAVVFAIAAVWLFIGAMGGRVGALESFLPPKAEALVSADQRSAERLSWLVNEYDRALELARTEQRLVFIDFTGYTCSNCRWMEANVFSSYDVQSALSQFILLRLYTDGEGEIYERQQQLQEAKFGTVALPLYAIVDGDGNSKATLAGVTRDRNEFLRFIRGMPQ